MLETKLGPQTSGLSLEVMACTVIKFQPIFIGIGCHKAGSEREADSEAMLSLEVADREVFLKSAPLVGQGRRQPWIEGDAELQCSPSASLHQPPGSSETGTALQSCSSLDEGQGLSPSMDQSLDGGRFGKRCDFQ